MGWLFGGSRIQNQWYHFGIGAPPILVFFSGDWDVHWGYLVLTHDLESPVFFGTQILILICSGLSHSLLRVRCFGSFPRASGGLCCHEETISSLGFARLCQSVKTEVTQLKARDAGDVVKARSRGPAYIWMHATEYVYCTLASA